MHPTDASRALFFAAEPVSMQFEWPATWCYMSVGQCFVALAVELLSIYLERKQQPAEEVAAESRNSSHRTASVTAYVTTAAVADKKGA